MAAMIELFALLELTPIKPLAASQFSTDQLIQLLNAASHYGTERLEGIYLRQDQGDWLKHWAKLVRSDFTQSIEEHWSKKAFCLIRFLLRDSGSFRFIVFKFFPDQQAQPTPL